MSREHAWTEGGLRIKRAALAAVEEDAIRGYAADEEACGYLRGPDAEPLLCDEAVAMRNQANDLHAKNPKIWFRTARTFFDFDARKFAAAFEASRDQGRPIKVVYHSHVDHGAYFSPTDRAMMSGGTPPNEEGGGYELGPGPGWPVAFLVTSVRSTGVDDHKLFVWDGQDFVESAFRVED